MAHVRILPLILMTIAIGAGARQGLAADGSWGLGHRGEGKSRGPGGVPARKRAGGPSGKKGGLGRKSDRCFRAPKAGGKDSAADPAGRQARVSPPFVLRSDRPAAESRRG